SSPTSTWQVEPAERLAFWRFRRPVGSAFYIRSTRWMTRAVPPPTTAAMHGSAIPRPAACCGSTIRFPRVGEVGSRERWQELDDSARFCPLFERKAWGEVAEWLKAHAC